MEKYFFNLIEKVSLIDVFKELYPKNKIEEEFNPDKKIKFYKTYSIFIKSNSRLPQMYLNEHSYFCFETGQKGFIPDLLIEKFNEENSISSFNCKKPKKSIDYLLKKLDKKFNKEEIKYFKKSFSNSCFSENKELISIDFEGSLLANNNCILGDGSWINTYTQKWEGHSLDWNKE